MQREIKFRAWNLNYKKMVFFDLKGFEYLNDKYFVVMQYTGLKDSKGVEIYEGDIVKSEWTKDSQRLISAQVIFSFGEFTCRGAKYNLYQYVDLEVIGNIYENQELLK